MNRPAPRLCAAATLFVVQDVPTTVAYYRDVLGFKVGFTYGAPVFYGGVERDEVTIHFQAAHQTHRQPGHGAANIFVTDVDRLHDELKSRGAKILLRRPTAPMVCAISTLTIQMAIV